MYFLLADLIHRIVYLKVGLALVLVWVGVKMVLEVDVLYVPTTVSLAVITPVMGASVAASLWATRGQGRREPERVGPPPFRLAGDDETAALEPLWRRASRGTPPSYGDEHDEASGDGDRVEGAVLGHEQDGEAGVGGRREPPAGRVGWTFLTNHAHVLLAVAADRDVKVEDLAARVGVTSRAVLHILGDLEAAGYVRRERVGRRTHYTVERHRPFRHPATAHHEVDELLDLFSRDGADGSAGH